MLRRLFSAELLGVSAFLYFFSISSSLAQDAKQGAAEEILRGVEKVYATCKSYRDSGTVASEELLAAGKQHDTAQFSTVFVRPDSFRFEYQRGADERKKRYIIWANGSAALFPLSSRRPCASSTKTARARRCLS